MNKSLIGLIGSAVLTFIGVMVRLKAYAMAVPREQEIAIGQIGMALVFAGILIFAATYVYWLFGKQPEK